MKINFLPTALFGCAVALVALGSLSSCKSNKTTEATAEEEVVAEQAELESQLDSVTLAKAGSYAPDFFKNPSNKAEEAAGATDSQFVQTPSGLKYVTVKEGTGNKPGPDNVVKVHYTGRLEDGTVFDSSIARGETIEFPLSGVIPGWTEGLQYMKEGGVNVFYIPADLAYGANGVPGVIPANAPLIFEVELIQVK